MQHIITCLEKFSASLHTMESIDVLEFIEPISEVLAQGNNLVYLGL